MTKRILLVDDDPLNLDLLTRRLGRSGFQVTTATNGQTAVEKARQELPHLILMDFSLPVLDGWTATRQIKADAATGHIPIIGVTAHALVGDREKALEAGCDDYETKPIDFSELLAKIMALLDTEDPAP
jgi:two-component system, cell cycle response regulator DivK